MSDAMSTNRNLRCADYSRSGNVIHIWTTEVLSPFGESEKYSGSLQFGGIGIALLNQGNNILEESGRWISPPGQEGWREAPGWWFNHKMDSVTKRAYCGGTVSCRAKLL